MITKNHSSAYKSLFEKASACLTKHKNYANDFKITNIDEYFGCLKDLAEIERLVEKNKISDNIDPIFTILPATEETFNIDANKRTISIPDNFAKHGIAVQGDEIAEILYFSIDRYFDAMDLADMAIIVQWKHSTDNDLPNNLSATYKKSLTLQPGKIVFGWPITSEITERQGTIQFAIRFYRRDEATKELIYSFSTLTTEVKIRPGLNFNLDESFTSLAINKNNKIYDNLRNSVPAQADYIIAAPVFTGRWTQAEDSDLWIPATSSSYDSLVTLIAKAEIPINTPDDHRSTSPLEYFWYDANNNKTPMTKEDGVAHIYKLITPFTTSNPYNKWETYYELIDSTYVPYYNDTNPADDVDEDGNPKELYVRYTSFTPTKAGTYYVVASNVYSHNSSASITSDSWTIVGAQIPEFIYETNTVLLNNDGKAMIKIEAQVSDNGSLTDKWYMSDSSAVFDNTATKIDGATGSEYEADKEGWYYRQVTNSKNGSESTGTSLAVFAVHEADVPEIIGTSGNHANTISVSVKAPARGTITYQWQTNDGVNLEGATNSAYSGNVGIYKCQVTNSYKGTSKTIVSDALAITG